MDLQKAKKILAKINSLYSGMENDADGNIATIEKDLMRSYVRQFYEIFLEESTPVAKPQRVKRKVEVIKSTPKPPPPAPKPAPAPAPRVIQLSEEVQDLVAEAKTTPAPPPMPTLKSPTPIVKAAPAPPPPPPAVEENEEVTALFSEKKATDLSEKLSSLPVTDLMKAMGLNERILTVNELFGGDANEFKKVMNDLNRFSNFDEAKQYLSANVIEKHDWTKRSKKGKAKVLIKTIRRRYS